MTDEQVVTALKELHHNLMQDVAEFDEPQTITEALVQSMTTVVVRDRAATVAMAIKHIEGNNG